MRLRRLSLENWRGVTAREIVFGDGVTLIEGPNEIGKSTLVEALQMLFREMDSSSKRNVKSIQPAGQDVGSRVEVEVQAGRHHFIYAKTYNKSKQTTLHVLAPDKRQLTGREAHETVEEMLAETVDMALWNALLVDQGEKVGLVNLQESTGLALALDAAAGNGAASNGAKAADESSLHAAVQAEYETFYTAKTGRPRFADLETACVAAAASLSAARSALAEVQENSRAHAEQSAEVRRLRAAIPKLEQEVGGHEARWQAIRSMEAKLTAKQQQLESAQTIRQDAERALLERRELIAEIAASETGVAAEQQRQAPLAAEIEALQKNISDARQAVEAGKARRLAAREAHERAQADATHLHKVDELATVSARLEQLQRIGEERQARLDAVANDKVDDAALENFRRAVTALELARGKRDAAAARISLTARTNLTALIDGTPVVLDESATHSRTVSAELDLSLPGIADIRVTPSASMADLAEETAEAEAEIVRLKAGLGVQTLEAAVAAHQRLKGAERALAQLHDREQQALQTASREALQHLAATLQAECGRYLRERDAATALPERASAATGRASDARDALSEAERLVEAAQQHLDELVVRHGERDAQLRTDQQLLAGLQAALENKRMHLERVRAERPDRHLIAAAEAAAQRALTLDKELAELGTALHESTPDAARSLLDNARAVAQRAASDLIAAERSLAVLSDRLERAQADGRFDAVERAEREFETTSQALDATRRRAAAAHLVWSMLNQQRDAARESYVRPLKTAIERLGTIVFGGGFEVEVGEDWSIVSRTHNGTTLPFEDLSVGAREQLGILARLAAAQIVCRQGGVPLIIDDALGFSDPSRLETMGAAIAAAGRDCQIIILTCTPGRFTYIGNANVVKFAPVG